MIHSLPALTSSLPALLKVDYADPASLSTQLADPTTLAVFDFAENSGFLSDTRYLHVALRPYGKPQIECWRVNGAVQQGRQDGVAWASDGQLLFAAIEIDETPGPDPGNVNLCHAAEIAYRKLIGFVRNTDTPHLLRIWNYLDAITLGDGDTERYRQFCIGRARGLGSLDPGQLPAATAIGRCDDVRQLQVYLLAGRERGTPVENPRQVSAYRYPRQYGPQPPSFARAMLPAEHSGMPLLISGTASVVGHASQHTGQLRGQISETFANFDALLEQARKYRPNLPTQFGAGTRLKVYVRDQADLPLVAEELNKRLGSDVHYLLLHAAICRRELAIEIDGVHS